MNEEKTMKKDRKEPGPDQTYLAFDIGGTGIKYALLDEEANILEQNETPTPKESLDDFLDIIRSVYESYAGMNLQALVMSAPGRIDSETGYFYTGGALNYLNECDMAAHISSFCPLDFTVINDAKAAALAELWKGALKDADSGIVITLGTGIGGAVVVDGKLWQGHTSAAGEFSGIPLQWNTRHSGVSGCWTSINSTTALMDQYAQRTGHERSEVNGRTFFAALEQGEADAREELDWFAETLATAVFGLQLILDVEKVCIGGGISRQPALLNAIQKAVINLFERMPVWSPASMPEVKTCRFFNEANLIGALYEHKNRTKNPTKEKTGKSETRQEHSGN